MSRDRYSNEYMYRILILETMMYESEDIIETKRIR